MNDQENKAANRFIALTLEEHDMKMEGNVSSEEAVQHVVESYGSTAERFGPKLEAAKWIGTLPEKCDLCGLKLKSQKFFVDGRTRMGPWANMCPRCFEQYGVGLGTGAGQKYDTKTGKKLGG